MTIPPVMNDVAALFGFIDRQSEVALENLVSAATDLDVGSVAVECLIAL